MYTFQQKKSISKSIADPAKVEVYRQMLAAKRLPASGTISRNRSALAVSMVYILLDHYTMDEIMAAGSTASIPVAQVADASVGFSSAAPKPAKISKFEQYPNIPWKQLDNPLVRMADSIFTDRINCYSELKKLEVQTQGEMSDFSTLAEIVRLAARLEMCFNELRSFNNTGKFLGKHPFIESKDERSRIFDLLRCDPEAYFQERKNVELNIARYSSQVNSAKLDADKKEKAKSNLEKYQAVLQVFKDVFSELIKR